MYQTKDTRGWMGIFGAVAVIIGMFMKVISVLGMGVTYLDCITDAPNTFGNLLCIAAIGLAIAGGVLYFQANTQIAQILSIAGIVVFLVSLFVVFEGEFFDLLSYIGLGFILMLAGYIVMILSKTLKNVNEKIEAAINSNKQQ